LIPSTSHLESINQLLQGFWIGTMTNPLSTSDLVKFQNYLEILARAQLGLRALPNLEIADVVQQTLTRAVEAFSQFNGQTEAELAGWLRAILASTISDILRRASALKRDARLEQSIHDALDSTSQSLASLLAADDPTPSVIVAANEQFRRVADALQGLPMDQRDAIILKYLCGLSLDELAATMKRSVPAVAGLLRRGLKQLRQSLNPGGGYE
jgi:RNA polymerase sigma-70 factor (ECF subfamily)